MVVHNSSRQDAADRQPLFGTDGIRGVAGIYPLDERTIFACGFSLVEILRKQLQRPPRLLIGRDTRESGPWIETVCSQGVLAAGGCVSSAGIITTPGVAYLTRTNGFDAGIVVSASHNVYHDNGIKIFSSAGTKLDDQTEKALEEAILCSRPMPMRAEKPGSLPPLLWADEHLRDEYVRFLVEEVGRGVDLSGWRVALDCAQGAAYEIAPAVFRRLGADVRAMGIEPTGRNINLDCGSLHPERLQQLVRDSGCDLGIAFDGDADRALFVGREGEIFDGDCVLFVLAHYLDNRQQLRGRIVVGTEMTNAGLEQALVRRHIRLVRTRVGDRYVLEKLMELDASLGGEPSGHIILSDVSLAGDGLITALAVLRVMIETGADLPGLLQGFERYPQKLINVPVQAKPPLETIPEVVATVERLRRELGARGRIVLRYSGTENLARVMVEADEDAKANFFAEQLADVLRRHLGDNRPSTQAEVSPEEVNTDVTTEGRG
ncbi:MAG TPA: phosphoglucosamine mutase [Blastocatellia bacterium]|nr:phosphoglucosamine mutase [Blastocatellia bacterium]